MAILEAAVEPCWVWLWKVLQLTSSCSSLINLIRSFLPMNGLIYKTTKIQNGKKTAKVKAANAHLRRWNHQLFDIIDWEITQLSSHSLPIDTSITCLSSSFLFHLWIHVKMGHDIRDMRLNLSQFQLKLNSMRGFVCRGDVAWCVWL